MHKRLQLLNRDRSICDPIHLVGYDVSLRHATALGQGGVRVIRGFRGMQNVLERGLGLRHVTPLHLGVGAQAAHKVVESHQVVDRSLLLHLVDLAGQRRIPLGLERVVAVSVVGIGVGALPDTSQKVLLIAGPQQEPQVPARELVPDVGGVGPMGVAVLLRQELAQQRVVHRVRLEALVSHLGVEERGQVSLRRPAPLAQLLLALPQLDQLLALLLLLLLVNGVLPLVRRGILVGLRGVHAVAVR